MRYNFRINYAYNIQNSDIFFFVFTQILLCVKNVKSRLWGFHFGFNSEVNR